MIAIYNQDRTEIIEAKSINIFDYGDKKSVKVWNVNGSCAIVGIYEPKRAMSILEDICYNIKYKEKIFFMPKD